MKTSVENLDEVKVKLTVEVEADRVKRAFAHAARELAKQVNLPGFRPGKAPRRILEQRFGAGAIAQAAMEHALTDYYIEALKLEELDPVAQPELDVETFDENDGCAFVATIEVRPEFEPADHTGISVTHPDWQIDESAIDEQIESLRQRFAEIDPVERAASTGDLVTLDLEVVVDGEVLEDARVSDALYEIGSAGVTPKLDDELVGKSAGDDFTYEDNLPEGFGDHGGELASFNVHVNDVREKTLPDVDDDFATTASAFDTLDELRADLRSSLLQRAILEARHQLRSTVLEAYLARNDVPLPPAMIDAEIEERRHRLEHQAEQFGMDVDALLQLQGTTADEFDEKSRDEATSAVKARLVLDRLAATLNVPMETQDIEREIVRHAQTNNMEPEDVAKVIQEQNSLPALVGDIMRRKAIDAIVEAANIDGGPSDDDLKDAGLLEDDTDEADEPESKLIVPGQGDAGAADEPKLIVPGRD